MSYLVALALADQLTVIDLSAPAVSSTFPGGAGIVHVAAVLAARDWSCPGQSPGFSATTSTNAALIPPRRKCLVHANSSWLAPRAGHQQTATLRHYAGLACSHEWQGMRGYGRDVGDREGGGDRAGQDGGPGRAGRPRPRPRRGNGRADRLGRRAAADSRHR